MDVNIGTRFIINGTGFIIPIFCETERGKPASFSSYNYYVLLDLFTRFVTGVSDLVRADINPLYFHPVQDEETGDILRFDPGRNGKPRGECYIDQKGILDCFSALLRDARQKTNSIVSEMCVMSDIAAIIKAETEIRMRFALWKKLNLLNVAASEGYKTSCNGAVKLISMTKLPNENWAQSIRIPIAGLLYEFDYAKNHRRDNVHNELIRKNDLQQTLIEDEEREEKVKQEQKIKASMEKKKQKKTRKKKNPAAKKTDDKSNISPSKPKNELVIKESKEGKEGKGDQDREKGEEEGKKKESCASQNLSLNVDARSFMPSWGEPEIEIGYESDSLVVLMCGSTSTLYRPSAIRCH